MRTEAPEVWDIIKHNGLDSQCYAIIRNCRLGMVRIVTPVGHWEEIKSIPRDSA